MIEFKHIVGNIKQIPILFLHGWGGGTESFEMLGNELCGEGKPSGILVNFKSVENRKVLTLFNYVDELNFLCERLKQEFGYKKFNIISHSFGARVTSVYADFYKSNVNKMVLTGAAGIRPKFNLKIFAKRNWFKFMKFLAKLKIVQPQKLNGYGSSDYKKLSPIMKQTFNNIIRYDCKPHYKSIKAQALLVFGSIDKETPPYMGRIINKCIKNSRLEVFEGQGHFLYLDKPDRFKLLCENFFME